MIRQSVRRLSTTAYKAAEVASKVDMSNQYGVQLAKAQGHVSGFVGGEGNSKSRYESKAKTVSAIGNTPLIRLKRLSDETGCEIAQHCMWSKMLKRKVSCGQEALLLKALLETQVLASHMFAGQKATS